jgi:hypothetical protein
MSLPMPGAAVVARRLLLVALAGLSPACFVFLDPNPEQADLPPLKNRKVNIVSFRPSEAGVDVPNRPDCQTPRPTFSVAVEDPDDDPLRAIWFVNPNQTLTVGPENSVINQPVLDPVDIRPPAVIYDLIGVLAANPVVVEFLVTDSDLSPDRDDGGATLVSVKRGTQQPGTLDRQRWFVNKVQCQ